MSNKLLDAFTFYVQSPQTNFLLNCTVHNNSKSPSTVGYLDKILLKIFATLDKLDSYNIRHKSYRKMGKFCEKIVP